LKREATEEEIERNFKETRRKVSRRCQQRWKKKQQKETAKEVTNLYFPPTVPFNLTSNVTHSMNIDNLRTHGFTIDPSLPRWERLANTILRMPPRQWFSRLDQTAFHNLCSRTKPPLGTRLLLGLSEKFCIERGRPPGVDRRFRINFERLRRSIRLRDYFKFQHQAKADDYIKELYISSNWEPPAILHGDMEQRMMSYAIKLEQLFRRASQRRRPRYNLSPLQYKVLQDLKENKEIIVCLTDKNLGPVVMDRADYMKRALNDHLNTSTYTRLSYLEAKKAMRDIQFDLEMLLEHYGDTLSKPEQQYFRRFLQLEDYRTKQFYITIKVHKNGATRPIVSCCGSFPEGFSKWLDYKMKSLLPLVPTYLRDSYQVLKELREFKDLPSNAKVFTFDAVSMYTNINTAHALEIFSKWFTDFKDEIPSGFPKTFFMKTLEKVMGNVFQFDDLFFHQEDGTAMGTSCAVLYATLYFGYHERTSIIPMFKTSFLYLKRFIDDGIGIWHGTTQEFERFKQALTFKNLRWTTSGLQDSVDFLDLNISIENGRIVTRTYEKPLNKFLYIPPTSAHSPGVLKSTIHGNVRRYWFQNSNIEDYKNQVRKFKSRLEARGHAHADLVPIFKEVFTALDKESKSPPSATTTTDSSNVLFQHGEYHPRGVSRRDICRAFMDTIGNDSGFDRFVIAYSRPRNIRDALIKSTLSDTDGVRASSFL